MRLAGARHPQNGTSQNPVKGEHSSICSAHSTESSPPSDEKGERSAAGHEGELFYGVSDRARRLARVDGTGSGMEW